MSAALSNEQWQERRAEKYWRELLKAEREIGALRADLERLKRENEELRRAKR